MPKKGKKFKRLMAEAPKKPSQIPVLAPKEKNPELCLGVKRINRRESKLKEIEAIWKYHLKESTPVGKVIGKCADEYHLMNNPIYKNVKANIEQENLYTVYNIGHGLMGHFFYHEAIFWLENFVKREENPQLQKEAHKNLVYACYETEDFDKAVKYGSYFKENYFVSFSKHTDQSLYCRDFDWLHEDHYKYLGDSALQIKDYKEAQYCYAKRLDCVLDFNKDPNIIMETLIDSVQTALKRRRPKKAQKYFHQFGFEDENANDMDLFINYLALSNEVNYKVYGDIKSDILIKFEKLNLSKPLVTSEPGASFAFFWRLNVLCRLKAITLQRLDKCYHNIEWQLTACYIANMIFLRSMNANYYLPIQYISTFICTGLEINEIDAEELDSMYPELYDELIRYAGHYLELLQATQLCIFEEFGGTFGILLYIEKNLIFSKRKNFQLFFQNVWKSMPRKMRKQHSYFKNSLMICDHFKYIKE